MPKRRTDYEKGFGVEKMNDKAIKDKWLADICEGDKVKAIMGVIRDARQDERRKGCKGMVGIAFHERELAAQRDTMEAGNAELKKEIGELKETENGRIAELESNVFYWECKIKRMKARWEMYGKILLEIHNCDGCGNRCDSHIDAWCDIIENIMEKELESGGEVKVGGNRDNALKLGKELRRPIVMPKPKGDKNDI